MGKRLYFVALMRERLKCLVHEENNYDFQNVFLFTVRRSLDLFRECCDANVRNGL